MVIREISNMNKNIPTMGKFWPPKWKFVSSIYIRITKPQLRTLKLQLGSFFWKFLVFVQGHTGIPTKETYHTYLMFSGFQELDLFIEGLHLCIKIVCDTSVTTQFLQGLQNTDPVIKVIFFNIWRMFIQSYSEYMFCEALKLANPTQVLLRPKSN